MADDIEHKALVAEGVEGGENFLLLKLTKSRSRRASVGARASQH